MELWIVSIISSVSTASLIAVLAYLSRTWIAKRIQYSIKHEYDFFEYEGHFIMTLLSIS